MLPTACDASMAKMMSNAIFAVEFEQERTVFMFPLGNVVVDE